MVQLLLDRGTCIEAVDDLYGQTALLDVILSRTPSSNKILVIGLLLDKSADLNAVDARGRPSLHFCGSMGYKDIHQVARFLLESGADSEFADPSGSTALHKAVYLG